MVTAAPPPLTAFARAWDGLDAQLRAAYPSAAFSGIIPDATHVANGGYHVSIEDLRRHGNGGDYSNSRPNDRRPPVSAQGAKYSVALDMSMNPVDMRKHYLRVRAVYDNRADPRRQYLNYVNTWDGIAGHGATRFDFVGNRILVATADHKWHVHTDWSRLNLDFSADLARAELALRAYRSVILGESVPQWLMGEGQILEVGMVVFDWGGRVRMTFGPVQGYVTMTSEAMYREWRSAYCDPPCYPAKGEDGFPTETLEERGWTAGDVERLYGRDMVEQLTNTTGPARPEE